MPEVAQIDANSRNTIALYNETTNLIEDALVDPVTGALYIYISPNTGGTFTAIDRAVIDANGRNTLSAFNEDTDDIESLRCLNGGELLVTIV